MAVPGSVIPLCQESSEESELQITGLFNPFVGHYLCSQITGLFNPLICEWHSAVFAEGFAGNFWTRWVLSALVLGAVS